MSLVLDRQRRERHLLDEPSAQRSGHVRHRLVARRAPGSPLPDLTPAVGRLVLERGGETQKIHGGRVDSARGSRGFVAERRWWRRLARLMRMIDLRSDTATKPSRAMREA